MEDDKTNYQKSPYLFMGMLIVIALMITAIGGPIDPSITEEIQQR